MSNKVLITAASVETFEKLEKKLNELPSQIKQNVESVCDEYGKPKYTLKQSFKTGRAIVAVSRTVTSIESDNDSGARVVCSDSVFEYNHPSKVGFAIEIW